MAITRRSKTLLILAVLTVALGAWWNGSRVEIVNAHPSGANVIAFGDSLTKGVGAGPGEDYPAQLSQLIGIPVLNRGVSGETTAQALKRLERDVLSQNPRIVIVCLGGNDLLQHQPVSQTFANLEEIVNQIQGKGALVVLVGIKGLMFADNHGPEYKKLAVRRGAVFVPDVLSGILSDPKLKFDQIHPNGQGYKIVAQRIYEAIRPYL
ncbi:MAG: arylesterase [Candidatus Sumerlaeaceae bacterium]|nr:arylesterase [Candidatus Sumerlaeaceae bacterium]